MPREIRRTQPSIVRHSAAHLRSVSLYGVVILVGNARLYAPVLTLLRRDRPGGGTR
jgi:hypothetical protein